MLSLEKVAAKLRIPYATVYNNLKKFVSNGHSFEVFVKRSNRFSFLSARVKQFLVDKRTLQKWAPYTIVERCAMVRRLFGESLGRTTLQRFYKSHDISFRSCKSVYRTYLTRQPQLEAQRKEFAVTLGNVVAQKLPLIYMDESSFNSFVIKPKSWSAKDQVNVHHRDNKRFSVTVFGAIGHPIEGLLFVMLARSTNQIDYRRFLRQLKQKVKSDVGNKPVLLYDGAPPHCTFNSHRTAEQLFFPLKNVAHSSDFNSIVSKTTVFDHKEVSLTF